MANLSIQPAATSPQRLFCLCIVVFLSSAFVPAFAQQSYAEFVGNCSIGSTTDTSVIVGYTCSRSLPTCQTYLYYRTQESETLADVVSRFNTTTSALEAANSGLSSSSSLFTNQPLFIPLTCSCNASSNYSLMAVPYTVRFNDNLYTIANSTFQGLTTCSGIQTSNPSVSAISLRPGSSLTIPLRCACPSKEQLKQGIKLLITYPIVLGDSPWAISSAFGVDVSLFEAANSFLQSPVILPQTTVLIPLPQKPETAPSLGTNASAPASPATGKKSSNIGMYVGIAIAAVFAGFLLALGVFYFSKREGKAAHDAKPMSEAPLMQNLEKMSSGFFKQREIDMSEINNKLPTYSTEKIIAATQGFDASNHVKGSVYRGMLKDQMVAIKKIDRNMSKEISILRSLNHSNLVPLLGVCVGSHESFLVYPFIGEGSLKDWLHEFPHKESPRWLHWSGRVQIAADIASALEYLHEYTKAKYLHKNVTSSNILVDANFRGKLSNLGLAKSTENMEQGSVLTSHIEGTQGYLAPEYLEHGKLSRKTDVFAFGVVLAEMLSGGFPIIRGNKGLQSPEKHGFLWENMSTLLQSDDTLSQDNLVNWMDPTLKGQYPIHCAMKMLLLATQCVAKDPALRPCMGSTAARLKEILKASQKWEGGGACDQTLGR